MVAVVRRPCLVSVGLLISFAGCTTASAPAPTEALRDLDAVIADLHRATRGRSLIETMPGWLLADCRTALSRGHLGDMTKQGLRWVLDNEDRWPNAEMASLPMKQVCLLGRLYLWLSDMEDVLPRMSATMPWRDLLDLVMRQNGYTSAQAAELCAYATELPELARSRLRHLSLRVLRDASEPRDKALFVRLLGTMARERGQLKRALSLCSIAAALDPDMDSADDAQLAELLALSGAFESSWDFVEKVRHAAGSEEDGPTEARVERLVMFWGKAKSTWHRLHDPKREHEHEHKESQEFVSIYRWRGELQKVDEILRGASSRGHPPPWWYAASGIRFMERGEFDHAREAFRHSNEAGAGGSAHDQLLAWMDLRRACFALARVLEKRAPLPTLWGPLRRLSRSVLQVTENPEFKQLEFWALLLDLVGEAAPAIEQRSWQRVPELLRVQRDTIMSLRHRDDGGVGIRLLPLLYLCVDPDAAQIRNVLRSPTPFEKNDASAKRLRYFLAMHLIGSEHARKSDHLVLRRLLQRSNMANDRKEYILAVDTAAEAHRKNDRRL